MPNIEEDKLMLDLVSKMETLKTPLKAFLAQKLLNSAKTESWWIYLAQLDNLDRIMTTVSQLYRPRLQADALATQNLPESQPFTRKFR